MSVAAAAVLLAPADVRAQQDEPPAGPSAEASEFAKPSQEQLDLNEEAVEALAKGRYGKAASLLEESHFHGALNITHLNLGRAYQRLGECDKARRELEAVDAAPKVRRPPPGLVAKKAIEYLDELDQTCSEEAASADSQDDEVEPPTHRDSASGGDSSTLWGATALGTGVAVAGTGLGLHLWAESVRDDVRQPEFNSDGQIVSLTQVQARQYETRADTLDTIALSSIIAGALISGVGTYLLLADPAEPSRVTLRLSGDDATLRWSTRF